MKKRMIGLAVILLVLAFQAASFASEASWDRVIQFENNRNSNNALIMQKNR